MTIENSQESLIKQTETVLPVEAKITEPTAEVLVSVSETMQKRVSFETRRYARI